MDEHKQYLLENKNFAREMILSNFSFDYNTLEIILEICKNNGTYFSWQDLSYNENIIWSDNLLDKYIRKFDISILGVNKSLPWSKEFIDKYKNYWYWSRECEEVTDSDGDPIDGWCYKSIFENPGIEWTTELLKEFQSRIDFADLSYTENIKWNFDKLNKFADKLNWLGISYSENIDFNEPLILKFKDLWYWDILYQNAKYCENSYLFHQYKTLTDDYKNCTEDDRIKIIMFNCSNIKLSQEEIDQYYSLVNFSKLSYNTKIDWTINFLERYSSKLDWGILASNKSLPWSEMLLDLVKKQIDKNNKMKISKNLSKNIKLPWTFELILNNKSILSEKSMARNMTIWDNIFKSDIDFDFVKYIFET